MLALKVLNDIDMAPRTALILALPTGFTLAFVKAWINVPPIAVAGVWILALVWLVMAWTVHLRHGAPGSTIRRVDLLMRYIVLAGLLAVGVGGLLGLTEVPLFIGLKLIALALCVGLGLLIRILLKPLGTAVMEMRTSGATDATDRAISAVIENTRPAVLMIWALILGASFLGIAMPL